MRLSIIIPAYNIEKYIDRCLRTVFSQKMTDFEVICVNDGSRDGTRTLIEGYCSQYSNLHLINQPNGGLSDARNTGLLHANGKYLFFLDGDDFLVDTYSLSNLLETSEQKNVDLCIFNALVDGKTKYLAPFPINNDVLCGEEMMNLFYSRCRTIIEPVWAQLYRREFLKSNNLFFKKGIYHEDLLFTPKALLSAPATICCDLPVVDYQTHREGAITTKTTQKHLVDKRNIAQELFEFYQSNGMRTDAPYHYLFNLYIEIVDAASDNHIPITHLIAKDDIALLKECVRNEKERRLLQLLTISPKLMNIYRKGSINRFVRKIISKLS